MRRTSNLKLYGVIFFGLEVIVQGCWVFGIYYNEWIYQYSLHNSFLLWCFAVGIFGESELLGWIGAIGVTAVAIFMLYYFLAFFINKKNHFIPLFLMSLNIVFHMASYWNNLNAYVGLLYKVIGCTIYACIAYKEYKTQKTTRQTNN